MANKTSANGTSNNMTAAEMNQYFDQKVKINYSKAEESLKILKDATQTYVTNIKTFDKDAFRSYLKNIGSNEKNLRNTARFLYYRSHIFFRLVRFYASMPDLRIRKVVPKYNLGEAYDKSQFLKDYDKNLTVLDQINIQGHSEQIWERCLVDDVAYGLYFIDDTGTFVYFLDADYCKITGYWGTNTLSFAMDMSYWNSRIRQKEMEALGEPLVSAFNEYTSSGQKWQNISITDHCYPFCFKFRMDDMNTIIPPLVTLFLSYINLADDEEIQAIAAQQQIFKLLYVPMKTISGTKQSDDFQVSPDLLIKYTQRMIDEALPDYTSCAVIPTDELGVVDFSSSATTDTNQLQQSQTQILDISGGGMVLNTSKITTSAGFEAALRMETEFALSSLRPQIDGFINLILIDKIGKSKACRVEHLEESIYTKDKYAESLLKSNQYSFSNRLIYNTCLGITEKETLTMEYLENTVLNLPELMNHPVSSSFTQSGEDNGYTSEVGQGAPTKDSGDLTPSGDRSRNQ